MIKPTTYAAEAPGTKLLVLGAVHGNENAEQPPSAASWPGSTPISLS